MNNRKFQATGQTYKLNATTSTQTITIQSSAPASNYLIANHQPTGGSGQPVYLSISSNSSVTVAAPANGTPANCFVSVPGTYLVVTGPQVSSGSNVYVAFIGEANSECYITPGEGN